MKMLRTSLPVSYYMDDRFDRGKFDISISPPHGGKVVLNIHQHGFVVGQEYNCHCGITPDHMSCEDCPTETFDKFENEVYNYIGLQFRNRLDAIKFLKTIVEDLEKQNEDL